jgi:hypothetical protein
MTLPGSGRGQIAGTCGRAALHKLSRRNVPARQAKCLHHRAFQPLSRDKAGAEWRRGHLGDLPRIPSRAASLLNIAEKVSLQIGHLSRTPFCLLRRRREPAHQRQHLNVVRIDIDQRSAFLAPGPDGSAPIHIWIETGVLWTSPTPSNAADLKHRQLFCWRNRRHRRCRNALNHALERLVN